MRAFSLFLVLAVFGLLFGAGLFSASVSQILNTEFTVPAGASYCVAGSFDTVTGGSVTVAYNVSVGTVDQYVMTAVQKAAFASGTGTGYLAATTGSRGTFSADLPSGGTYYVIACHGAGSENLAQAGLATITINAWSTAPFVAGLVGISAGVVFAGIAFALRHRPSRASQLAATVPGPTGYATIVLTVENGTAAAETVQIVVNGAVVGELPVPAGQSVGATLHPALANAYGSRVRVEAVLRDGRRATQDLTVTAFAGQSMSLRIPPAGEGATAPRLGPS